jgi:hypothetical protein
LPGFRRGFRSGRMTGRSMKMASHGRGFLGRAVCGTGVVRMPAEERCNPSQQPSDGDDRVKPGHDGVGSLGAARQRHGLLALQQHCFRRLGGSLITLICPPQGAPTCTSASISPTRASAPPRP